MSAYICKTCLADKKEAVVSEDEVENKVKPNWSEDQVKSLSQYQHSNAYFPFVCPENHILQAESSGLYCSDCEFVLKWSYEWTLDWSWKDLEPPEEVGDRAKLPPNSPLDSAAIALNEPSSNDQESL